MYLTPSFVAWAYRVSDASIVHPSGVQAQISVYYILPRIFLPVGGKIVAQKEDTGPSGTFLMSDRIMS